MTDPYSFYRTILPPEALRPYIRSLWIYDGYRPEHLLDRVLPTGTLEIVVPVRGKRLSWRELSGRDGTCRTALVSGPRRSAFDVPTAPQGRLVGVHFHPGGAWPLFAIPMDALAEQHHPLEDLLGASARELAERIDDAASDAERLAMLSDFFLQRARASRASHPAVARMMRRAERGSSDVVIAAEVAASGLSHRRFIELFRREVGLTPRDYLRVQRFQRALDLAARTGRAGADLAYEAGYADQSHWILECRKHAGLSPRELLEKQRGARAVPPAERGQMLPIR
ncbi:AraC family transcriptional regulator [Polyangium sp. 15x6]|uniref:helix-turn-helix domain-containing protein n=1 Tax=Polyangium sp. 15x6 TaxID=3042687 RepID=UPI00249A2647|nr:AraC family transcriptional regulator [Polyangium sp. 15x6]MDI3285670.1 AraC family transcriptional regulator [Polyangium sp. 15x6]